MALEVKNLPANAGDVRGGGSVPGSGRSPGGGDGNPLQYSCLKNPIDRAVWPIPSIGLQIVRHDWSSLAHIFALNSAAVHKTTLTSDIKFKFRGSQTILKFDSFLKTVTEFCKALVVMMYYSERILIKGRVQESSKYELLVHGHSQCIHANCLASPHNDM